MALASTSFYSNHSDERKAFQYERSPFTSVSLGAMTYKPTDRILSLSKPKARKETTIREGNLSKFFSSREKTPALFFEGFSRYASDPTYSGVTPAATRAACSTRVTELAAPVKRNVNYQYELPLPRPVPTGALKYQATPRVTELAEPKKVLGA